MKQVRDLPLYDRLKEVRNAELDISDLGHVAIASRRFGVRAIVDSNG